MMPFHVKVPICSGINKALEDLLGYLEEQGIKHFAGCDIKDLSIRASLASEHSFIRTYYVRVGADYGLEGMEDGYMLSHRLPANEVLLAGLKEVKEMVQKGRTWDLVQATMKRAEYQRNGKDVADKLRSIADSIEETGIASLHQFEMRRNLPEPRFEIGNNRPYWITKNQPVHLNLSYTPAPK